MGNIIGGEQLFKGHRQGKGSPTSIFQLKRTDSIHQKKKEPKSTQKIKTLYLSLTFSFRRPYLLQFLEARTGNSGLCNPYRLKAYFQPGNNRQHRKRMARPYYKKCIGSWWK
jgi:hypothetical protein